MSGPLIVGNANRLERRLSKSRVGRTHKCYQVALVLSSYWISL
jgi:hypothetical protein